MDLKLQMFKVASAKDQSSNRLLPVLARSGYLTQYTQGSPKNNKGLHLYILVPESARDTYVHVYNVDTGIPPRTGSKPYTFNTCSHQFPSS